jgi:hypothetical protein
MKTFVTKISASLAISFLFLTLTTITSCKKEKTTHGTVTVKNAAGVAVNGAKVVLSAYSATSGTLKPPITGTTDASGTAKFDVQLPGIWDVNVTKDTLTGQGVLRLDEPGKKDEITIVIR